MLMKIQGPRTIESQQLNKPKKSKSKSSHTKPSRLNSSTSRRASLSLQSTEHFFLSKDIRLYTGKQRSKSLHCFSYRNILSNKITASRLNTSTSRYASLSLQSSKHFFLSKYIRLYIGKQRFKSPHCFSNQNILSNKIKIPTQKKTLPKTRQTSKPSKTTIPRTRSLPSFCT